MAVVCCEFGVCLKRLGKPLNYSDFIQFRIKDLRNANANTKSYGYTHHIRYVCSVAIV
jgi:hypothetical protein